MTEFITRHGGVAGTVHRRDGEVLSLAGAHNIPPKVQEVTKLIPKGKGMAGLAWERAQPVQTCNLKTDNTGDVRPGAKAVNAKAAVALPVHADNDELLAVVGIAYNDERELDEATLQLLDEQAREVLQLLPG